MSTSQNGWPVITDRAKLTDRAVRGVTFPHGWLRGDVDVIFTDLIDRLNTEVEPIDNGGCWGWFVKPIEGSTTISNHSSGTAIDYNAPAHPMGTRGTYSAADQARIRIILRSYDGVVRWGGDYTGRPDDMHFEINKNAAAVKAVANKLREAAVATVDLGNNAANRAVFDDQLLDVASTPKDGGTGFVNLKEVGRQVQVTKNRITELAVGPGLDGDARSLYKRLTDIETSIATLTATVNNMAVIVTKLDLDPADEPPQENPIVIGTRYAIAHPS